MKLPAGLRLLADRRLPVRQKHIFSVAIFFKKTPDHI
jgi:hypothetical protein